MKKVITAGLGFLFLFESCIINPFEEILFRTTEDPFYDVPEADSLTLENTVYLTWKEDDAADSYILMRSRDSSVTNFMQVYEGKNISFTDTEIETDDRYLYRLDKKRGTKVFTGKNIAYAFSGGVRKDSCESNDTEENASELIYDLNCNLPCVQYVTSGYLYKDCDWYYVKVPPYRSAEVLIRQNNYLSNYSDNTETKLIYMIPGSSEKVVIQNNAIYLSNSTNEAKNITFKITVDTIGLLSEAGSSPIAIEYSVTLNRIVKY